MSNTAENIIETIAVASLPVLNEAKMQDAIGELITAEGIAFEREVCLNARDRIDFLCGQTGIEVKIKGSYSQVANQLLRYAESELVNHLILVTGRASHRKLQHLPNERNIPIDVIFTSTYAF